MLKTLLTDQRIHLNNYFYYLYPPYYYRWLITDIFTHGIYFWVCLGFASPSFVAIAFLIKNRKNYYLVFIYLLISLIFLVFPIFGKIFNGGAYITNRWSWVLALIVGYIVSITYDHLMACDKKDYLYLITVISIYAFLLFYLQSNKANVYLELCVAFIALLVIINITTHRDKQFIVCCLYMISIFLVSYYLFSPKHRNYIKECVKQDNVNNYTFDNEGKDIKDYLNEINDNEYLRYSGTYYKDRHNNLINNVSSTAHYFPISNGYASNLLRNLAMSIYRNFIWTSYDEKTIINELASVKYFVTKDDKDVPYGYSLIKKIDNYKLYKNDYFIPVLYTYDSVCDENSINNLNYPTKQEIMMKSGIVSNYKGKIEKRNYNELINNLPYEIKTLTKDIYVGNNYFLSYGNNQQLEISFNGLDNSETYCFFNNLNYLSLSKYDFYKKKEYNINNIIYDIDPQNRYTIDKYNQFTYKEKRNLLFDKMNMIGAEKTAVELLFNIDGYIKRLKFSNNRDAGYGGFHNFLMNIGYNKKQINKFIITLPYSGIYTFDDIKMYCDNFENYKLDVEKLKQGVYNIKVGGDMVEANVNIDQAKYLCLGVPYSDGWKVYIDDEEYPIYLTNFYHMGTDIPKGAHRIRFVYRNPYIIYGRLLSLFGFIFFIVLIVYNKKTKKFINRI